MTENYECEDISTLNEINLLKCKLDTKSQVLKSLSKELIICKKEKEEFKMMMEQLGEKCSLMKRRIERLNSLKGQNEEDNFGSMDDYNHLVLNQNYKKLQETNKQLNFEINDLRIKYVDAESDLRLLRDKISKLKKRDNYSDNIIDNIIELNNKTTKNQYLIEQIEKLKMKNKELTKDLKLNLDEKEDLIKSRNNFIQKAERLNESLNALMNNENINKLNNKLSSNLTNENHKFLDIDSILTENQFLKEKLKCLEQDNKFNEEMINKYKQALDKSNLNKKNFFELSNLTNIKKKDKQLNYLDNESIVSTKELQSFIESNNLDNLELNETTLIKLRKLVLMLFESITDKTTALNLAKTNNRLLGKRINDLENKLSLYENKEKNLRIETFKINKLNSNEDDEIFRIEDNKNQLINQNLNEFSDCLSDLISIENKSVLSKNDTLIKEENTNNNYEQISNEIFKKDNKLKDDQLTKNEIINDLETFDDNSTIKLPDNLMILVENELKKLNNTD